MKSFHMDNDTINIKSIVSNRDYRPFVQLAWGKEGCQMTLMKLASMLMPC